MRERDTCSIALWPAATSLVPKEIVALMTIKSAWKMHFWSSTSCVTTVFGRLAAEGTICLTRFWAGKLYLHPLLPPSWVPGNCLKIFILSKFWKLIFRCRSSTTITKKSRGRQSYNVSGSSRRFIARHRRTCKEKSEKPSLILWGLTTIRTELEKNSDVAVGFYPLSGIIYFFKSLNQSKLL